MVLCCGDGKQNKLTFESTEKWSARDVCRICDRLVNIPSFGLNAKARLWSNGEILHHMLFRAQ